MTADLPRIDEHAITVDASVAAVWQALTEYFRDQTQAAERYARLIGADPSDRSGSFPEPGACVAGFRVTAARPNEQLVLRGGHRFSTYSLVFGFDARERETRLSATTYASFPGLSGAVYRGLVIGSASHRVMVRRLLRAVDHGSRRT